MSATTVNNRKQFIILTTLTDSPQDIFRPDLLANKNSNHNEQTSYLSHIMPYFIVFLEFFPPSSKRKYRARAPTWHSKFCNGRHTEMLGLPRTRISPSPLFPNASMQRGRKLNRGILQ